MKKYFILLIALVFPVEFSVTSYKIVFSGFTADDLNIGYKTADFTYTSPIGVDIDTQNNWSTFIQAGDVLINSNNHSLPIDNIEWKISNNSENEYKPLLIDKQLITTSNLQNGYFELNFRVKANWLTPSGIYYLPIDIYLEESKNLSNKRKRVRKRPN